VVLDACLLQEMSYLSQLTTKLRHDFNLTDRAGNGPSASLEATH
jgi:hypothetical protein